MITMKTIGMVGETGWMSSVEYYTLTIHALAAVDFALN
jgi:aspartate/glutamate racemase